MVHPWEFVQAFFAADLPIADYPGGSGDGAAWVGFWPILTTS